MNKIPESVMQEIKSKYWGYQVFDCNNVIGDPMELVYHKDGVEISATEEYGYLDVIGLNEEEYKRFCTEMGGRRIK